MNRLTTDHPQNNFETVMNLVYGKDGWQYIRYGETETRTTDFCLMLCKERGCVALENPMSDEEKDEFLCDCAFNGIIELVKQTSADYRRYSRKADCAHSRTCVWLSIPGRKRKMQTGYRHLLAEFQDSLILL